MKKAKDFQLAEAHSHYKHKYTKEQIRKCATLTAKIHKVKIDEVYETIAENNATLYKLQLPEDIHLPKEVRDIIFDGEYL